MMSVGGLLGDCKECQIENSTLAWAFRGALDDLILILDHLDAISDRPELH